ncbi:redoxin domain-containing protein [Sphingobacteriaceae bacterium WQ 2009]|uniref:Redoxin domain-containing protein n=2 Tax=Rhinopithecimicrobium faecis TaxID=2820698 RepID=A0A8T4HA60_9SPHI|nr:redoxin domain-containing protein [Sphingobacteriaceae bacterium WQ 2009]
MGLLSACTGNADKGTDSNTQAPIENTANAVDEHAGHNHAPGEGHDHAAEVKPAAQAPATLPDFTFYILKSGIKVSKADLSTTKNSAFLLFDPGCGHCQQEAVALEKNIASLKNVDLYFVSMNDPALILGFMKSFMPKLGNADNVEVLFDKTQDFISKIHIPNQFPANYVYGPDGKLKASWEGEKNINEVIAAFNK